MNSYVLLVLLSGSAAVFGADKVADPTPNYNFLNHETTRPSILNFFDDYTTKEPPTFDFLRNHHRTQPKEHPQTSIIDRTMDIFVINLIRDIMDFMSLFMQLMLGLLNAHSRRNV